jgi:DNA-binding LacI/PurR family transcriptional regulator
MLNYSNQNVLDNTMRTTIRDVARRLNLSITTVSRGLDGYDDVSEDTRKLIIQTAAEMGYSPNRAARQLRRQQTDSIGYILPSANSGLADPFFSDFIAGLADEAADNNFDLLISTAAPESDSEQAIYQRWVQSGKVDGMVLNRLLMDDWRVKYLVDRQIPHVSLERTAHSGNFSGVEVNARAGILELMEHLVNQGHSRIAYIGANLDYKIEQDRREAYLEGLKWAAITPNPALMTRAELTPAGGYQAALHLFDLALTPTAIFCVNDLTAIGAMHAAHERGMKVGRDIAIAGFDGIADSAHTQPGLTTIDQPVYDISRKLVSLLLALIKGESPEPRSVEIRPRLIIRESTGNR